MRSDPVAPDPTSAMVTRGDPPRPGGGLGIGLGERRPVTTTAGAQSATMASNRAAGSVTASGTKMAPTHRQARAATTKSTELGRSRRHPVPLAHPPGPEPATEPGRLRRRSPA